jgi:hypothetical protein
VDYDAIQPPEPIAGVEIREPQLFAYVHGKLNIVGTAAGEGFKTYQVQVGKGLNPENWIQVGAPGTAPVTNGTLGVWDTQGQEGLYAVRLQVVREDQTVETSTIQVTVDNAAPLVRVPYPLAGQTFQLPQDRSITFQAEVSDSIGLQRVVWLVDGKQIGERVNAPYALSWQALKGEHVLEVKAYDYAGNIGASEQVHFSVK